MSNDQIKGKFEKAVGYLNELREGLENKGHDNEVKSISKKIDKLNQYTQEEKEIPESVRQSVDKFVEKADRARENLSQSLSRHDKDLELEV